MTIHQAKGLEFPVVVVGSLHTQLSTSKQIDRDLQPFYQRPRLAPENRVTEFDRMRLHYVAFSRPEEVLVLTCPTQPKDHFDAIWQGLPQYPHVQKELLAAQSFKLKDRIPLKQSFSFTGDLKLYETCPRQYQFFREYDFTPSRSAVIFFGLLVRQTIEEIHRLVLDGKLAELDGPRIRSFVRSHLQFPDSGRCPPHWPGCAESAFSQAMNYFRQNQAEMQRVVETEVDVSVEKDDYILTGKMDLLMGGDGKLELLDFKTSPRPTNSPTLLPTYERQLCTYAHILEKRYGKRPERLLLYWTAGERKTDALMQSLYNPLLVDEADREFDAVVGKIKVEDFRITVVPEKAICKGCDMRSYCTSDGIVKNLD